MVSVEQYKAQLDAATARIPRSVSAALTLNGVPTDAAGYDKLGALLLRGVQNARADTHAIARDELLAEGVSPSIMPVAPAEYLLGAVSHRIAGFAEASVARNEGTGLPEYQTIAKLSEQLGGVLQHDAVQPSRDLVVEAATGPEADAKGGWARILVGATSCSFCAMMASRGAVYTSKDTAIGKGGSPLTAYHKPRPGKGGGLCDCIPRYVKRGQNYQGRAEALALYDLYQHARDLDPDEDAAEYARLRLPDDADVHQVFRAVWNEKVRNGTSAKYIPDEVKKRKPKAEAETEAPELDADTDERARPRPAVDPLPHIVAQAELTRPETLEARMADLALVNPRWKDFGTGNQWTHNCTRCAMAVELRAQGYDVTAGPLIAKDNGYQSILRRWTSPDGTRAGGDFGDSVDRTALADEAAPRGQNKKGTGEPLGMGSRPTGSGDSRVWDFLPAKGRGKVNKAKAAADAAVAEWGEGARGFITVTWSGGRSAHIFNVENRGGVAHYLDGQSNEIDASAHWDGIATKDNTCRIVRTDDMTPRSVPGQKQDPTGKLHPPRTEVGAEEWIIERDQPYLAERAKVDAERAILKAKEDAERAQRAIEDAERQARYQARIAEDKAKREAEEKAREGRLFADNDDIADGYAETGRRGHLNAFARGATLYRDQPNTTPDHGDAVYRFPDNPEAQDAYLEGYEFAKQFHADKLAKQGSGLDDFFKSFDTPDAPFTEGPKPPLGTAIRAGKLQGREGDELLLFAQGANAARVQAEPTPPSYNGTPAYLAGFEWYRQWRAAQ